MIRETLNCVTDQVILAHQDSEHLYRLFFRAPARLDATNGDRFYILVNQSFTVVQDSNGLCRVHSREYSYILSDAPSPATKGIVSYHWHPHESALRDPHLHLHITQNMGYPEIERKIARAHYPTSRVCLEDFLLLLIKYYDINPITPDSVWKRVLKKNKQLFEQDATWFVGHRE